MDSKIIISFICIFFISQLHLNAQKKSEKKNDTRKEIKKLKKYVHCICLYQVLPEKEKVIEKEGSASHYIQIGSSPLSIYDKLFDFLKKKLEIDKHKYINFYEQPNIGIVRCIDIYESKSLDSIVKKLVLEGK